MKLPRRLKKQLKARILHGADPAWKPSEVKITGYNKRKNKITSYTLGL